MFGMNDHASSPSAGKGIPSESRRRRWLIAILLVGACLILACSALLRSNQANRFLATSASTGLTVIAASVWFLFFSGISPKTRHRLILGTTAGFIALLSMVKLEGCSGDNHPIFAWRWAKPHVQKFDVSGPSTAVDLTHTTRDDSPQFLGPQRDAQFTDVKLDRDWEAHPPKLIWKKPIGKGWSSFAVVGDFAVTQEQRDNQEWTVCYRVSTGDVCWTHTDPDEFTSVIGGDGPRSTPTIDDGRVYTFGVMGRLSCLDGATGKAIWSHTLLDPKAENFTQLFPEWGKSCSPLVTDRLVIVSRGLPDGHSLEAYGKVTGLLVWGSGDAPSAYDSPVRATLNGVDQIVIVNRESVDGHDYRTGRHLWSFAWPGKEPKVPQPIPVGSDRLFVAAGYGIGAKLLELSHTGDDWKVDELWAKRTMKPKFTNVIIRDGVVIGIDDGTALTCIDLATGERKWRGGRYGHGQILQVGELMLVQAESGEVVLVEATPEKCEELGRFTALADKTWNEPTLVGRLLLVRNDREAACYELPVAE